VSAKFSGEKTVRENNRGLKTGVENAGKEVGPSRQKQERTSPASVRNKKFFNCEKGGRKRLIGQGETWRRGRGAELDHLIEGRGNGAGWRKLQKRKTPGWGETQIFLENPMQKKRQNEKQSKRVGGGHLPESICDVSRDKKEKKRKNKSGVKQRKKKGGGEGGDEGTQTTTKRLKRRKENQPLQHCPKGPTCFQNR